MKFKSIQLATLLTFVMAIMMLSPLQEGLGGDPSAHVPSLWINGDSTSDNYGKLETPADPGTDLIGTAVDPRGKSFNEMCGTNGDESVGCFAWYYRGGKLSDSVGHEKETTDTTSDRHLTTYKQNIYTVYLNGSAQTTANQALGSLDPGISEAEAIELSAAHESESFQGQGKITLEIYKTDYHVPQYRAGGAAGFYNAGEYSGCETRTSDEYYFRPDSESVLKVVVHIENVKEKRAGGIDVGGDFKGANANFTHTWEWEKSWFKTKGRGFGMSASVGGWWTAYWNPVIKVQEKSATVNGYVENAGLATVIAEFDKRNSWCPNDTGYSQTPRAYVPHSSQ